MTDYYSEIVSKAIPFHLWDEWIKKKLMELSKMKEWYFLIF